MTTGIPREALALARRIKLLVEGGAEYRPSRKWNGSEWEDVSSQERPFKYSDIMILLRAGTRQGLYEAALREYGIKFTTGGKGRGFFYRQEVRDVSALLTWCCDPKDELALLAVLRSPFIGITDPAVAVIASEKRGLESLTWNDSALDRLKEAGLADDGSALASGLELLSMLKQLAGRISAAELVRKAVEMTGFDAVLTGSFHGSQRLANLQKLISVIHETERAHNLSLPELSDWLAGQINESQEPDALVSDPDDDAVQISTAHSSKGLTSPIVFLPDLANPATAGGGSSIHFHIAESDDELTMEASLPMPSDDGGRIARETGEFGDEKEAARIERDEEGRRLLYVAIHAGSQSGGSVGRTPQRRQTLLGQYAQLLDLRLYYGQGLRRFEQAHRFP